ncbi:MAG: prepilin-type N-terminal cleavage/methylation domain-containing protein [Gemmatimonadetes bacterium]|nr:prepilin-type N-terminal cleavage/methylation domain-containing protein [Gemmatimonadota bacterium]
MGMSKKSGFTLIELLIVVVIIGILASVAIPKFAASREKSFVSTMKTDLKNLATFQEIHHNGAYTYSTSLSTLEMTPSSGVTITINEATGSGWAATAAHAGLISEHCGIYQGNAAVAGGDPGAVEGVIACTR